MPRLLLWSLIAWLLANLVQATFMELLHDEAYYWVFSQRLSIVYFDQMPGVAYFIRAGTSLVPGELGVRLFSVLVSPITLFFYYRLSGIGDPRWFIAIAFSMVAIHFNGFFTSPDSVLSFTLVLFLLGYRQYLRDGGWRQAGLLALAAAAVGYSKYQGILFIFILALVEYRLWKRATFWLVIIGAALLVLPIYLTDPHTVEVTLRFQLVERGTQEFSLLKPLDFLSSQLMILGPFATPMVIWAWIRFRPQDRFMRSLLLTSYIYFGILVLLSLRAKVEANWSAPILGLQVMFAAAYYSSHIRSWKWIRLMAGLSLVGFLLLRLWLMWDFLPASLSQRMRPETHGWRHWAEQVREIAGEEPVVFWNSYQLPSKYWYYTGRPSTCISNSSYRKNQFTLLPMEQHLQGKAVWLVAGFPHTTGAKEISTPSGHRVYMGRTPQFYSYSEIRITADVPKVLHAGDTLDLSIHLHNEAPSGRLLLASDDGPVNIGYSWIGNGHENPSGRDGTDLRGQSADPDRTMVIHPVVPTTPGRYALSIHILTNLYQLSYNSDRIPVTVVSE